MNCFFILLKCAVYRFNRWYFRKYTIQCIDTKSVTDVAMFYIAHNLLGKCQFDKTFELALLYSNISKKNEKKKRPVYRLFNAAFGALENYSQLNQYVIVKKFHSYLLLPISLERSFFLKAFYQKNFDYLPLFKTIL